MPGEEERFGERQRPCFAWVILTNRFVQQRCLFIQNNQHLILQSISNSLSIYPLIPMKSSRFRERQRLCFVWVILTNRLVQKKCLHVQNNLYLILQSISSSLSIYPLIPMKSSVYIWKGRKVQGKAKTVLCFSDSCKPVWATNLFCYYFVESKRKGEGWCIVNIFV